MSLILLIITPAGLIGIVFGIGLLVYSIKNKPLPEEPRQRITAAYVDTRTGPADPPEGMPSAKPRKRITTKVAGVTFRCGLDRSESRQEILNGIYDGDPVEIQEYEYKGSPAYYVIDPQTGLDFGNLPADVAMKISQIEDPIFEAYVTDRGSFDPDDGRDPIEYCEIRVFVI